MMNETKTVSFPLQEKIARKIIQNLAKHETDKIRFGSHAKQRMLERGITMTPYHYTESGLDNIYLLNGVNFVQEDGDTFTSIDDLEQLHIQIGKTLVEKTSPLLAKEFRFLRIELNLSQKALAELLGVDSQTIARWEKGETTIPRVSDVVLRAYYSESLQEDSRIGLMLKTLAETETSQAMTRIAFEAQNHHWMRKVA